MANVLHAAGGSALAILLLLSAGCQSYRAPGNLLPSLAAAREDKAIAAHAANSKFPSPSDVGLETKTK